MINRLVGLVRRLFGGQAVAPEEPSGIATATRVVVRTSKLPTPEFRSQLENYVRGVAGLIRRRTLDADSKRAQASVDAHRHEREIEGRRAGLEKLREERAEYAAPVLVFATFLVFAAGEASLAGWFWWMDGQPLAFACLSGMGTVGIAIFLLHFMDSKGPGSFSFWPAAIVFGVLVLSMGTVRAAEIGVGGGAASLGYIALAALVVAGASVPAQRLMRKWLYITYLDRLITLRQCALQELVVVQDNARAYVHTCEEQEAEQDAWLRHIQDQSLAQFPDHFLPHDDGEVTDQGKESYGHNPTSGVPGQPVGGVESAPAGGAGSDGRGEQGRDCDAAGPGEDPKPLPRFDPDSC